MKKLPFILMVIIAVTSLLLTHCSSGTRILPQGVTKFETIIPNEYTIVRTLDSELNIACYTYFGNASAISCTRY